ncbi:hypothetical protein [Methanoculleus sp.]|uniref:hypothetical protein n=1 Tax=Methanoculleus sp. TaxID=90427 RepID=UPI002600127F|nr:hypothetical protein [Methanoculleus sp.]
MKSGPISTGTATAGAIVLATVLMTVVAAALLVPGGQMEIAGATLSPDTLVEVVAGHSGAPVIRILSGADETINLTECRIYLIDPRGTLHGVDTAVLENTTLSQGQSAYIFHLNRESRAASGYWITDEPDLVFTDTYHHEIHPFSPGGQWRVVVYDPDSMKNRIDRAVRINGPASRG